MKTKKPRIAMIVYNPFPIDSRVRKEAIYLKNAGFHITIFCLRFPNEKKTENYYDIVVSRLMFISSFRSRVSLVKLFMFWIITIFNLRKSKYQIIHAHDPTGLPPALFYKLLNWKTNLIYDSHELFPENAREITGYFGMTLAIGLELLSSLFIDSIVTVSQEIAYYLKKRYNPSRIITVINSPTLEEINFLLSQQKKNDVIKIVYAGSIQPQRGYIELLEATLILKYQNLPKYKIVILGDGPLLNQLKGFVESNELSNYVELKGYLEFREYLKVVGSSHIGLILFQGKNYQVLSTPVRGYEYIFSNLLIIISKSMSRSSKKLIKDYGHFYIEVDSKSPKSIANGIIDSIKKIEETRGETSKFEQKKPVSELTWENQVLKLINLYKSLLKQ